MQRQDRDRHVKFTDAIKFIEAKNEYTNVANFTLETGSITFWSLANGDRGYVSKCLNANPGTWRIWTKYHNHKMSEIIISYSHNISLYNYLSYGNIQQTISNFQEINRRKLKNYKWSREIIMPGCVMTVADTRKITGFKYPLESRYDPSIYSYVNGFTIEPIDAIDHTKISLAIVNGKVDAIRISFHRKN